MRSKDLKLRMSKAARSFRKDLGLGLLDPFPIESILLDQSVLSVFRPMSAALSGMAVKVSQDGIARRFMLVNSNQTRGRQFFTMAHELYHLFIQEHFQSMICQTGRYQWKDREEYKADWFASYLLLPPEGLLHQLPETEIRKDHISLLSLIKIEQYYQCSRSMLLYRLRELDLISERFHHRYSQDVIHQVKANGFSTDLYRADRSTRLLGDYVSKAKALFEKGAISEGHLFELLGTVGIDPATATGIQEQ